MTRRLLYTLCAMLAAGAGPARASQAPGSLPNAIVESATLTQQQQQQIDEYIAGALKRMTSTEPLEVKKGREMLLEPLKDQRITVAFRQSYGEKLSPELIKLAGGQVELISINALRVAGEVATPESAGALESRLGDQRMAVRYAAVAGIGRSFEAMTAFSPAMVPARAQELVAKLGEVVAQEQQPEVLDAAVRALISAMRMSREGHGPIRADALTVLCERGAERLKKMGPIDAAAPAMLRVLTGVREAVTVNNPGMQPGPAGIKKGAELAGHTIAYVLRNIKEFEQPGEPQKSMLTEAETILTAAGQRAGGVYPGFQLSDLFIRDPQRGFYQNALKAIQWLHGKPFEFSNGTFLKEAPGGG